MGAKNSSYILFLMLVGVLFVSCNKEENTIIFSKTKLAAVTNLRAFSYDGNSVALIWTRSTDSDKSDFLDVRITVKDGASEYLTRVVSKAFTDSALIVSNLNEGTVYTFEIVSRAGAGSQSFINSDPVSIRWASARRLNGGAAIKVYEIASPDSTGLQFFDGLGVARVFGNIPAFQGIIDVVVDSTASGIVIMKSGHLNRLGGGLRRTKFSTFDTLVSTLNISRVTPPDPSTYTRDSIFIGPQSLTSGKMFYALTNDSNYVRILFERNPNPSELTFGSLLFGTQPRRYLSVKLSYQITRGIIYAKPKQRIDEVRN